MIEVELVFAPDSRMPPGPGTVRHRAVVAALPERKSHIAEPGEGPSWRVSDVVFEYREGFESPPTVHVLCIPVGVPNWLEDRVEGEGQ